MTEETERKPVSARAPIFCLLVTLTLLLGYFFACEKEYPVIDVPSEAIIDTTILDTKGYDFHTRSVGDGYLDIIILGDKYKGRDGLALFLQTADSVKKYLTTIYPMTEYVPVIRFHYKNSKQDLGCRDNSTLTEGWVCSEGKVINAALDVAGSFFTVDQVIVLAYGEGRGGATGSGICAIGVGTMQSTVSCNIWRGIKGKVRHEFFHNICGLNHPSCIPWNLMCTCGNGCCDVADAPLLPECQTATINYIQNITQ